MSLFLLLSFTFLAGLDGFTGRFLLFLFINNSPAFRSGSTYNMLSSAAIGGSNLAIGFLLKLVPMQEFM